MDARHKAAARDDGGQQRGRQKNAGSRRRARPTHPPQAAWGGWEPTGWEGECAHVPSGPGRAQPAQQLSLLPGTAATRRRARGSGPSGQVQQGPWGKKREERRPHHQRVRRARGGSRDDGQVARSRTARQREGQIKQHSRTFHPPPLIRHRGATWPDASLCKLFHERKILERGGPFKSTPNTR